MNVIDFVKNEEKFERFLDDAMVFVASIAIILLGYILFWGKI